MTENKIVGDRQVSWVWVMRTLGSNLGKFLTEFTLDWQIIQLANCQNMFIFYLSRD